MDFLNDPIKLKVFNTCLLMVMAGVIRIISNQAVMRANMKSTALRQRWRMQVRNITLLIILMGILLIWGEQLRTLVLSLFAVMAAFVIATKELILCLTGSLLKGSSSSFTIGDRIVVGDYRGVVTDQTLLSTTLHEIGPANCSQQLTGKTIVIPNSLFLIQGVINENSTSEYKLHSFSFKCKTMEYFPEIEKRLLEKMQNIITPYRENAVREIKRYLPGSDITENTCLPKINLVDMEGESATILLRLPVASHKTGHIEQALLRFYNNVLNDLKKTNKENCGS